MSLTLGQLYYISVPNDWLLPKNRAAAIHRCTATCTICNRQTEQLSATQQQKPPMKEHSTADNKEKVQDRAPVESHVPAQTSSPSSVPAAAPVIVKHQGYTLGQHYYAAIPEEMLKKITYPEISVSSCPPMRRTVAATVPPSIIATPTPKQTQVQVVSLPPQKSKVEASDQKPSTSTKSPAPIYTLGQLYYMNVHNIERIKYPAYSMPVIINEDIVAPVVPAKISEIKPAETAKATEMASKIVEEHADDDGDEDEENEQQTENKKKKKKSKSKKSSATPDMSVKLKEIADREKELIEKTEFVDSLLKRVMTQTQKPTPRSAKERTARTKAMAAKLYSVTLGKDAPSAIKNLELTLLPELLSVADDAELMRVQSIELQNKLDSSQVELIKVKERLNDMKKLCIALDESEKASRKQIEILSAEQLRHEQDRTYYGDALKDLDSRIKETSDTSAKVHKENAALHHRNAALTQQIKLMEKTQSLEKQMHEAQLEQSKLMIAKLTAETNNAVAVNERMSNDYRDAAQKLTEYSQLCTSMSETLQTYRKEQSKYVKMAETATTERDKAMDRARKADVNTQELLNQLETHRALVNKLQNQNQTLQGLCRALQAKQQTQ